PLPVSIKTKTIHEESSNAGDPDASTTAMETTHEEVVVGRNFRTNTVLHQIDLQTQMKILAYDIIPIEILGWHKSKNIYKFIFWLYTHEDSMNNEQILNIIQTI
ncbi:hypothetical protein ACJX0J_007923, partial [Zea mays]